MNWYYLDGENSVGPLTETTMMELRACGMLSADTLVCQQGNENWQRFDQTLMKINQSPKPYKSIISELLIKFSCPHCQQDISTESSSAGLTAACPSCGGDIVVPLTESDISATARSLPLNGLKSGLSGLGNRSADEAADASEMAASGKSAAGRIKAGTIAGWADVKRHSKTAVLHAQIEKLRNVDLRKAYHALGKRCYELGLLEVQLATPFEAIREIEARIAADRKTEQAPEEGKKTDALKRMTRQVANATHAQALNLKLQHLLTEFGRLAYPHNEQGNLPGLETEVEAIGVIETLIHRKENEVENIGGKPSKASRSKVLVAVAALILITAIGIPLLSNGKNGPSSEGDSSRASNAEKQVIQGQNYYKGEGVPQDYEKAFELFSEAAEQGNPRAQIALGHMYFDGESVDKSPRQALNWWSHAAEQGFHEGQYMLGTFHLTVTGEKILAYMWLNLASSSYEARISRVSREKRDALAHDMSSDAIKEAQKMSRNWKPNQPNQPGSLRTGDGKSKHANDKRTSNYSPEAKSSSRTVSSSERENISNIPGLDDAIAIIANIYPELTRSEHIKVLEDISGLRMTSSANAGRATQKVENLKSLARMGGQSEREFFDLNQRQRSELEEDVRGVMSR